MKLVLRSPELLDLRAAVSVHQEAVTVHEKEAIVQVEKAVLVQEEMGEEEIIEESEVQEIGDIKHAKIKKRLSVIAKTANRTPIPYEYKRYCLPKW